MRRPKKWEIVRVKWTDATTVYEPAHSEDEHETATRYTSGHLIAFSRIKGITVAMEDDREADDPEVDCQTKTTVPFGMIERVVVYPEKAVPFVAYQRPKR